MLAEPSNEQKSAAQRWDGFIDTPARFQDNKSPEILWAQGPDDSPSNPERTQKSNSIPSQGHTEDLGLNERTRCGTMGHNQVLKSEPEQWLRCKPWQWNPKVNGGEMLSWAIQKGGESLVPMYHCWHQHLHYKLWCTSQAGPCIQRLLHIETHEIGIVSSVL